MANLAIINLQYTSTLRCFDAFVGWGWGPSSPRFSSASHLYWAPLSSLSGRIRSVTVSFTGVSMVSVKGVWFSTVCTLYHLTVRFWTGATLWTSHWSSYCFPSVIGPLWFTVLMNTLSGVSVEEDLHTLKSAVMNVHLLDISENEQKKISVTEKLTVNSDWEHYITLSTINLIYVAEWLYVPFCQFWHSPCDQILGFGHGHCSLTGFPSHPIMQDWSVTVNCNRITVPHNNSLWVELNRTFSLCTC